MGSRSLEIGSGVEPLVGLMRRFAVELINGHDAAVCAEIMAPDYRLRIGGQLIAGRDEHYVPAIQSQFDQFPGMGMTVHRLLVSGDRCALHFSEHGASGGSGGRLAAWQGIALYRSREGRLGDCVVEEDYFARRRQLTSGLVDPIAPPSVAPWDTVAQAPDLQAEAVVRRWLEQSWPAATKDLLCDDEHLGSGPQLAFEVTAVEVTELFSAGSEVAFHVRQSGRYRGGLPGIPGASTAAALFCAGIVEVADGAVRAGSVIRDRAGLQRALRAG